ncbi:MAG: transporter [Novosphingobium sp.]|nr:transporter [Novosphingobium sp.]
MSARAALLAIPLLAIALAGCSLEPKYTRTELPVPSSWPVGDAYLRQSEAALPSYRWQDVFGDPRLKAVIAQALVNNQDLAVAAANIAAARAQFKIQRAELLPEIDLGASASRRGGGATADGNSFSLDAGINGYELDLFGRIRSETKAAQNRYFATEAGARATRLTLVSDVADAWLAYATDTSLMRIAERTAANARQSVTLTRTRLDGGIAPRTDLRQAEITLHTAEASIADQTTLVAQDVNALQLLVGAPIDPANLPATIDEAGARLSEVPAGLDSTILLRRPDVVQAEWQLRAANAEIGAARAALFPKISLTTLLGFAAPGLGSLFSSGSFNYSAGVDANYPIFRAGAGKANVALTEAQRDAALGTYRKAIQSAFADVADTLARRGTIDRQLAAAQAGRAAAADNANLAEMRYRGGITSFLESLTAQQALYNAERSLADVQRLRATNLIALYRSLGGEAFD